ncbi:hypothetical protein EZV73_14935 [Acidaminobacter sp. JC074]|uniref:hypothetical protein n=1 Tax=Acidaminobacter sp. JC074 TaxID=2530199 RepID=UPI001F106ABD|nr:hypothetical protein [Acidaminobacter sp. JC074]MCH4888889.1 hypothetical protein [Acidaminobacter sp. JC074]
MKKSILILCFILLVCTPAYAEENVDVVIPEFNVLLNGGEYNSIEAQYPLINYNGITYFPMTWNLGQSLGLNTSYTSESGLTINLGQSNGSLNYLKGGSNLINQTYKAQLPAYNITVNGESIDNSSEEYPILSFRSVTYFPLTWRFAVEKFNWDYAFTPDSGLDIGAKNTNSPIQSNETTDVKEEYVVDNKGIVTIEHTFKAEDLKKNTYGITEYIGLADFGNDMMSYVFEHKNDDFNNYFYDTKIAFYKSDDTFIQAMYSYGSLYESVEGKAGENRRGLYGEPKIYDYVVMTVTMYPEDVYADMNQSISKNLIVDNVSIKDISKDLLDSEGAYFIAASYYDLSNNSDPSLALYSLYNEPKRIELPDGKFYRTAPGLETEFIPYTSDNSNRKEVSTFGSIKVVGENNLVTEGTVTNDDGSTNSFSDGIGQYYVMLLFDEDQKPFKILVNSDELDK